MTRWDRPFAVAFVGSVLSAMLAGAAGLGVFVAWSFVAATASAIGLAAGSAHSAREAMTQTDRLIEAEFKLEVIPVTEDLRNSAQEAVARVAAETGMGPTTVQVQGDALLVRWARGSYRLEAKFWRWPDSSSVGPLLVDVDSRWRAYGPPWWDRAGAPVLSEDFLHVLRRFR